MLQIIVDFGTREIFGLVVPLRVYGYGLMLVFGFICGIYLARWHARRVGENPDNFTQCGILALVGGVAGARIAFVIEKWDIFAQSESPLVQMVNITGGGLIYYGGVILALVLVVAYLRLKRLPIRRYLDILAASTMIGLAFGRAGCLLNGCCYGAVCDEHWPLAMRFPMYSRPLIKLDGRENPFSASQEGPSPVYAHQLSVGAVVPPAELVCPSGDPRMGPVGLVRPRDFTPEQVRIAEATWSRPVCPAQILGIANALLIAALLVAFLRIRRREGQVFALMLILYPISRFLLEMIRQDNPHDLLSGVLTHNQYTSLATVAAGIILLGALYKLPATAAATSPPRRREAKAGTGRRKAGRQPHSKERV